MTRTIQIAALTVLMAGAGPTAAAQTHVVPTPATRVESQPAPKEPAASPPAASGWHRWIDWQSATIDARYRAIESSEGRVEVHQLQHRQTLRGAFKLDRRARYTVQAAFSTGAAITSSWAPTGLGTGAPTWGFVPRTLYVSAKPVEGVELQVGGLTVVRGHGSEITSYDNDVYLTGERVTIARPDRLFFDELSVTAAYLGDDTTPNVFRRVDRLDDHNYTHVLAAKSFGARVAVSVDWTQSPVDTTWRQAVHVDTRNVAPIDGLRVELYERATDPRAEGVAIVAEKALTKTLSFMGGYSNVDRRVPTLTGDRYGPGHRGFAEATIKLRPELTLTTYFTHAFANDFRVANGTRFDVVMSYNVLRSLQRASWW